ncbi:MAG: DUF3179 domain-containing protein [Acidobacteria bacterium]|nr:DUF3179 domain-containing protein [Acidobacteriota bacterium]
MSRIVRSLCVLALIPALGHASGQPPSEPDVNLFFQAAAIDEKQARLALEAIATGWRDGYAAMLVDLARLLPAARDRAPLSLRPDDGGPDRPDSPFAGLPEPPAPLDPRTEARQRVVRFLEKQTGERFGDDLNRWRQWIWSLPYEPHPDYARFKGALYGAIDPRMRLFFPAGAQSRIRLDQVDWGGVIVNGIPPLDHPRTAPSREASYLKDSNIVFGLELNGDARAYPRRIIAWHELVRDRLGGIEITLVYCTLCGTVIPYSSEVGGVVRRFGTSGLLYRSNKLMFDEETNSLWSTFEGKPVIGALAGSGLVLPTHPLVTTSWGEWRAEHPSTSVLTLDTGFKRDYSEGAAYRDYFSTDRLMFQVFGRDDRLGNKDEVLVLEPGPSSTSRPLAIAVRFLESHPIYHTQLSGRDLVIVTSAGGANRVYDSGSIRFVRRVSDGSIVDANGIPWRVNESELVSTELPPRILPRVPAHRAFWFGWRAQHPDTELIR